MKTMIRQDEDGEGYVILREAVDEWGNPTPGRWFAWAWAPTMDAARELDTETPGRTMISFGLGESQIAALRAKFPPGYTLGAAAYEIVARAIEEAQP